MNITYTYLEDNSPLKELVVIILKSDYGELYRH